MNSRSQIRILYGLATLVVCLGVAMATFQVLGIDQKIASHMPVRKVKTQEKQTVSIREEISLAKFEPLWSKRLQGRPVEPAPIKQVAAPPLKTAPKTIARPSVRLPDVKVIAIMHSERFSIATMLLNGKQYSLTEGEEFQNIKLVKIERGKVTLSYQATEFNREIEK